jgi:hypothetical protein
VGRCEWNKSTPNTADGKLARHDDDTRSHVQIAGYKSGKFLLVSTAAQGRQASSFIDLSFEPASVNVLSQIINKPSGNLYSARIQLAVLVEQVINVQARSRANHPL